MTRTSHPKTGSSAEEEAELYRHIGNKIRIFREQIGWSQERLATELQITPNTVSRWETATYRPSAADLDRLARIFGVQIWAFFPPSVEPPMEAQKALLSATGDLPEDDLDELRRYADFIRARKALAPRRRRRAG